ncbi:MAG: DUF3126 domain-containing protein [Alphaproteobacteria bacterium CG_4_9_14_3_um_filter_47_13]|nr:MAG: DUF3126 domain-containing protein [Alphaproteobacteria bacterium CG_4_9_14_3_um_filter_47_13]
MDITTIEAISLQKYLQRKFRNTEITLRERAQAKDSVEVLLGGEFIGIIYKDDEDKDDVSYDFNMAILSMDLKEAA